MNNQSDRWKERKQVNVWNQTQNKEQRINAKPSPPVT
jgi:hypothetical protein